MLDVLYQIAYNPLFVVVDTLRVGEFEPLMFSLETLEGANWAKRLLAVCNPLLSGPFLLILFSHLLKPGQIIRQPS